MAPRLRQRIIRGGQRSALPGRYHRGPDNRLESFEGSSSGSHVREVPQNPELDQEEEAPTHIMQRGRSGPRKSTIVHQEHPLPRKTEPLLAQEAEGEDTDVWIMDSEGTWTRVPDAEYPIATILCAPATRPPRRPTAKEEDVAQEFAYPIMEEDPDSEDDVEDS